MIRPSALRLSMPVSPRDHMRGPADAPVTLVEYGNYECPNSRAAHPMVESLRRQSASYLRFVFRHFPITTVHPHAERAAEAAEAAAAQGAFWDLHDRFLESRGPLNDPTILRYAGAIGLDIPRLERELDPGRHHARVREDFTSGVRSGVNGTPTFFVNDERHDGPHDLPSLAAAVEDALQTAREELEEIR